MRRCSRLFNSLFGSFPEMHLPAAADKPPTSNPIEDLAECEPDLLSLSPASN